MALRFLSEIYNLRRVIDSIDKHYFDAHGILFSSDSQGFEELLALVQKTVNIFNGDLAGDLERLERLLAEAEDGQDESSLTVDLAGLMENVGEAATEQIAYLVDLAKADALEILGENRQALEFVDRRV